MANGNGNVKAPITENENLLPHSVEAERAVLGAVLVNPDAFLDVRADSRLRPEHFFIERHAWLWNAYERLVERGDPIDYLTVTQELEAVGKLAEFGGAAEVLSLVNATPTALNAEGYGRIVVRMWWRRDRLDRLSHAARLVHSENLDVLEIDTQIRDLLAENALVGTTVHPAKRLFGKFYEDIRDRMQTPDRGLSAGMFEIDAVFSGRFRLGEYTILQGLANLGKSFFATQIAIAAAYQLPVLYFTFEGSADEVRDRMVAIHAKVPLNEVASGKFTNDANLNRAMQAAYELAELPIDVVDSLTDIGEVRRQVEAAILRHDFARPMVFIDNLNNIADVMPGKPYDNLTRVSAEALNIARQTGAGVFGLAQQANLYNPAEMGSVERIKRALTPSMRTIEGSRKLAQHPHNMYGLYSADYIRDRIVRGPYEDMECPPQCVVLVNCRQRNAAGATSAVLGWDRWIPRFTTKRAADTADIWKRLRGTGEGEGA